MDKDPQSRFQESEPTPTDDANIRELMGALGVSYAEARQKWEMMKAESALKKMKIEQEEEEK